MITQDEVKKLFFCRDGKLFWRSSRNHRRRIKAGDEAGCVDARGYRVVGIYGSNFFVHRVIWLWKYGYFPENQIDHIDRNKLNNRINNLREVSQTCNMRNTGNRKKNISGVKGVNTNNRPRKKYSKEWRAIISNNCRQHVIGHFDDLLEAACHRLAAEQCLNWQGCDSSSPAFQYVQKHINKEAK